MVFGRGRCFLPVDEPQLTVASEIRLYHHPAVVRGPCASGHVLTLLLADSRCTFMYIRIFFPHKLNPGAPLNRTGMLLLTCSCAEPSTWGLLGRREDAFNGCDNRRVLYGKI